MAKQMTLFSAWGQKVEHSDGKSTTIDKPEPQDHPPDLDDLGLTEADLEEIYKMDEQDVTPKTTSTSFHVGPSHSFLNSSIIEDGIPGFDKEAGKMWIYPTNYPVRDYQYNIVHKALFTNTLVCLPTGLGKTFIAAVVMYNFYRWYPNGKIVFLAPTKPLVTQQMEACHDIMGIPQLHTVEMTGQLHPKARVSLWQDKRVFFLTPQVMQNDLSKGTCTCSQDVCCLVFDEAHKALGKHAYCQVVKELNMTKVRFRVLALSATPGNDLKAVQDVVSNLQIGHIELRMEGSLDIQRYVNERSVEKIVVPLEGEILEIRKNFATILSGVLSRLVQQKVFYQCSIDRLSKMQLIEARRKFRITGPPAGVLSGAVEGNFALAMSLSHAYELLVQHGMRSFYNFLSNSFAVDVPSKAKTEILRSSLFRGIMASLKDRVMANSHLAPDGPSFPRRDGSGPEKRDRAFFYSHPKLHRLEEVVLGHFRQSERETRVIIFSQYRDSVEEIAEMLKRHTPLVKVMTFVGHSSGKSSNKGLSQREQTQIVSQFRSGGYNTLVSTCVGEEGLDIGDVDLIVCFDAPKSPIRLVQRMGRTGRKRKGRIVMILAEGKEDNSFGKSQSNKKSIDRAICNGCKTLTFYQHCHRMVPRNIHPQVHKMHMTVGEFISSKKDPVPHSKPTSVTKIRSNGKKVKQGTYLSSQELSSWSEGLSLTDKEFDAVSKSIQRCFKPSPLLSLSKSHTQNQFTDTSLNTSRTTASFQVGLDKWVGQQTARMSYKTIAPSLTTQKFVSVLEFSDLLRTSEEMGESYDMEMATYLNKCDVKSATNEIINEGNCHSPTVSDIVNEGNCHSRTVSLSPLVQKKQRTKKRLLDSDSEDDDFKPDCKHSTPYKKHTSSEKNKLISLKEVSINEHSKAKSLNNSLSLTQSGHAIPLPPTDDDLSWLDQLEPSQLTISHTSVNNPSFDDSEMNFKEADFDFDTPNVIPTSRLKLQPKSCSTPTVVAPPTTSHVTQLDTWSVNSNKDMERRHTGMERGHTGMEQGQNIIVLSDSDNDVHMIEESDYEDNIESETNNESVSKLSTNAIKTPLKEDSLSEDSFLNVVRKCRKRPLKSRPAFFRSPSTVSPITYEGRPPVPSETPVRCTKRQRVTFDNDSSDDDFIERPLRVKRRIKQPPGDQPALQRANNDFIEEEAEVSDEDGPPTQTDYSEQFLNSYDHEDSFINDNSMLTQMSPSQRFVKTPKRKKTKMSKSEANSNNLYIRSLMSPEDHRFAGQRKGYGSKYRMVFSQRHELLNHYIDKAGFKVHQDDKKKSRKRDCNKLSDSDLFIAESSGSEAEEVYGCVEECGSEGMEECGSDVCKGVDDYEKSDSEEEDACECVEDREVSSDSDSVVISPSLMVE